MANTFSRALIKKAYYIIYFYKKYINPARKTIFYRKNK
jgi:hypothetical protein